MDLIILADGPPCRGSWFRYHTHGRTIGEGGTSCSGEPRGRVGRPAFSAARLSRPALKETDRAGLMVSLERGFRGQNDVYFSEDTGETEAPYVVVTGFDPSLLGLGIRRSSPSGAVVLALAEAVNRTDAMAGEAVLFPCAGATSPTSTPRTGPRPRSSRTGPGRSS